MELQHSFTVPTSVDQAWATFMDLEKVGSCFPGATVTEVTDDGFSGTVKVKLGPIALVYAGSGEFTERDDAAHRAVIKASGKDKRGNGTAGATVTIQLEQEGEGTRADIATDLAITGKPAQFGRGVMQDVSDKLLAAFVSCIEARLERGDAAEEAGEVAPSAPEPVSTEANTEASTKASTEASTEEATEGSDQQADVWASPSDAADARAAASKVNGAGSAAASVSGAGGAAGAVGATGAAASGVRSVPEVPEVDDAIDLGAAVGPVLVQRYAGYAAAGLVGFILGWLLRRRR